VISISRNAEVPNKDKVFEDYKCVKPLKINHFNQVIKMLFINININFTYKFKVMVSPKHFANCNEIACYNFNQLANKT